MDFYEEYRDEKRNKDGVREHHRWTEDETIEMLRSISKMLKEPDTNFERPTAKVFYEEMKFKYFSECTLTSNVLKSKMRHLKSSYLKAKEWKDTVGMQLYDSDQRHVKSRIKSICPHYNLLDDIFGPSSNADPIGFRLPEAQTDDEIILSDCAKTPAKRAREERSEPLLVPKIETFNDEQSDFEDESQDTIVDEYEESYNEICPSNTSCVNYNKKENGSKPKRNSGKPAKFSLEERTFQLEKQKFQSNHTLQSRRINLEEKKFKFEKEKFEKMQRMRKYEIDKQFAIKKQEIESNERLRRLELAKSTESVVAEVMTSYDHDVTEEELCSEIIE